MTDYAIGDIQGCYDPLMRLLEHLDFNETADRLWFVGDLVNRGPQSLEVLRFISRLPLKPIITLGNHDLHLLVSIFGQNPKKNSDDTLRSVMQAPDCEELGHWLRHQSLLHHDKELNIVMSHAGIAPVWNLHQAKQCAAELEAILHSDDFILFLDVMYGNEPNIWSENLQGLDRLRLITNYFTRMRFCEQDGSLVMHYKGKIMDAPSTLVPWFNVPHRKVIEADLVFGHWAALEGYCPIPHIHAIDTGCLWGGQLTALRLEDKKRFSVSGLAGGHLIDD